MISVGVRGTHIVNPLYTLPKKEKGSGEMPDPRYRCVNETHGCFKTVTTNYDRRHRRPDDRVRHQSDSHVAAVLFDVSSSIR